MRPRRQPPTTARQQILNNGLVYPSAIPLQSMQVCKQDAKI
jgi:hypothetical protein